MRRASSKDDGMTYAQGDTVVHPRHGAATVTSISTRDLGQGPVEYLELHIEAGALKILVPAESVQSVGLRSLSSRRDAERILALLEETSEVPSEWSERNATTQTRMRSHELEQMAMVVRDLLRHERRINKPLTVSERGTLDTCRGILARELSLSLDVSQDDILALIAEKGSGETAVAGDTDAPASGTTPSPRPRRPAKTPVRRQ